MGLAFTNTMLFTGISIFAWFVPISLPYWHVKRWYLGLGFLGKMEMNMSLTGYNFDLGCDKYAFDFTKAICKNKFEQPISGHHSFHELKDFVCNLHEQTRGVVFRGCDDIRILTWVSITTLFIIIVSLILMAVGGIFLWIYYNNHASKRIWSFSKVSFALAPLLQLVALGLYAMLTGEIEDFFRVQAIPNVGGLSPRSPSTITLNASFFIAIFCNLVSWVPLIIMVASLRRDANLEEKSGNPMTDEEAKFLEAYDPYGYGTQGALPGGYDPNSYQAPYPPQSDPYAPQTSDPYAQ